MLFPRRNPTLLLLVLFAVIVPFSGCDDGSSTSGPKTNATPEELFPDGCDPISPDFCGLPFPSNIWTVADSTTPTGLRVHLHDTMPQPQRSDDSYVDLSALRFSDGFSPGSEILAFFPNVALDGTAPVTDPAASLAADSKTVLIDAETGEHIPHWVELDMRAADDTARDLLIRPAVRLEDSTRYIVAIRGLVDTTGATIAPSPAFKALRDGKSFNHPSIGGRRALYADIFTRLASAGVAKGYLQLAWDFTTASRENNTQRMVKIRDLALAALAGNPAQVSITSMQDNVDANIARRIEGTIHVPLFLDDPGPGGRLVLDANGVPMQNGYADYPFLLEIPVSAVSSTATATPKPVLQYGHGLFGSRYEIDDANFRTFANQFGYVMLTMDWLGMSNADYGKLGTIVNAGELSQFETVADRGQQAMLNNILVLDAVLRTLSSDSRTMVNPGQPTIQTTDPRFYGQSLGGIYGSTYLTLSPIITRGVLLVPGQAMTFIMPRSNAYDSFKVLLTGTFYDDRRLPLVLDLIQMLWDRVEPTGYTKYMRTAEIPGTIPHEVLIMDTIGDQTVSTLGAQIMARAIDIPLVGEQARPVFGLDATPSPHTGSGFVEFNFGPTESTINVPSRAPGNPHSKLSQQGSPVARQMAADFLSTGVITNLCSGPCDPF